MAFTGWRRLVWFRARRRGRRGMRFGIAVSGVSARLGECGTMTKPMTKSLYAGLAARDVVPGMWCLGCGDGGGPRCGRVAGALRACLIGVLIVGACGG